jgi:hypothetical protein
MSAAEFSEDFEGGSNGSTITAVNTGFNTFNGTGTRTFDNTHAANGTLSAKCVSTGVPGVYVQLVHTFNVTQGAFYLRMAVYIAALPAAPTVIATANATGVSPDLRINTDGTITIRNNGSGVATTTATIPTNSWFLVEWKVDSGQSTQTARLYSGLTGTPVETTLPSTYDQGALSSVMVGITATSNMTVWVDAVATSFSDWVGPLSDIANANWLYV